MRGAEPFEGGGLAFRGTRFVDDKPRDVPKRVVPLSDFAPGEAILHLGGTFHEALPITSGARENLIVWLFGEHGTVRVAPHDESERLSGRERWAAWRGLGVKRPHPVCAEADAS